MKVTLFLTQPTHFNTHGQSESVTQLWQCRLFVPNTDPAGSVVRWMPEVWNQNRRGYFSGLLLISGYGRVKTGCLVVSPSLREPVRYMG